MNIPLLQLIAAIFLLGVVFFLAAGVFMFGARMGRRTAQRLHRGDALLPEPSAPVENVTAAASAAVLGRDAEQALPPKQTAPVPASPDAQDTRTLVSPPPAVTVAVAAAATSTAPQKIDPLLKWREMFLRGTNTASRQVGVAVSIKSVIAEWGIVVFCVWLFSTGFMTLGTQNPLSGPESEIFQALDWVLVNNLKNFGEFPQWNPFILSGLPYVGDPFLHLYNPLVTVPVLLMGVLDGYKVGVFLSFVAAALSAWYLGKVMGVGRVGRLFLALSYAFTGRAVAQFLQGQYDLIFSFAWIPLCIAGFIALAETRRPFHAALTAIALALLFLSGNVYYTFYMLFVFVLFVLVYLFRFKREPFKIGLDLDLLRVLLIAGGLAAALSAVQLLPFAGVWPQLNKQGDPTLRSSHTLSQIWLDYTSTEKEREDTKFFAQETYSYIGYVPFLGLLLAPLAWFKQKKRVIVFMLLLFGLALVWASGRETPLRTFFESSTLLTQFRYPTRFLLYGALGLLSLTALGVDSVFKFMPPFNLSEWRTTKWDVPRVASVVGGGALCLLLLWSVADVFGSNKRFAVTFNVYAPAWETASALREFDASPNYVQTPYSWVGALAANSLRNLGMFYGFSLERSFENAFNRRPVPLKANYFILAADQTPNVVNPQEVLDVNGLKVYRLPESLPFAFVANDAVLREAGQGELRAQDVTEVKPLRVSANVLEFEIETPDDASLVVMSPRFDGWNVRVDGLPWGLRNVDGFLAVPTQAGKHLYTFTYDSWLFKLGLVISSIALIVAGWMLLADRLALRVPGFRV